jgi:hypothetical protein
MIFGPSRMLEAAGALNEECTFPYINGNQGRSNPPRFFRSFSCSEIERRKVENYYIFHVVILGF